MKLYESSSSDPTVFTVRVQKVLVYSVKQLSSIE